jgi:hypothetical protein
MAALDRGLALAYTGHNPWLPRNVPDQRTSYVWIGAPKRYLSNHAMM